MTSATRSAGSTARGWASGVAAELGDRSRALSRCLRLAGLVVLLALPRPASGLDPSRRPDQYLVRAWTTDDGLPHHTVSALVQSRDGYLWLGTQKGLVRFDGVRFVAFTPGDTPALAVGNVKALLEGADGSLWIGDYGGGLVRYRDGELVRFGREAGLPSLLVRALAPAPDGLWIGSEDGGLARFDGQRVVERLSEAEGLPSRFVWTLLEGRSGELWIGTDHGLGRLEDGRLRRWTKAEGLLGDHVTDLLEDRRGDLWVATTWGVNRFQGERLFAYGLAEGLGSDYVFSLGEDRDGNVWAGTGGGGLARFAGERFEALGTAEGLPNDYVWSILEDREGNLWVGTEGGVARLRAGPFSSWGRRQGLPDDLVRGLRETRSGEMLLATPKGLARIAGGRVSTLTTRDGLPADYVWSVLETAGGDLWLGTDGAGVARVRDGRVTVHRARDGLGSETVWSLAEDRDGAVWAGTQQAGLARFAGGRWTRFDRRDGLGADVVRVVLVDRSGAVWAGTTGGGLSRLEGGRIVTYTARDGLGSDTVLALHEDADGVLWVGTLGGGLALREGERFVALPKPSLGAQTVGSIVEDDLGFLWLSTDRGLRRARRSDLLALARGERTAVDVAGWGAAHGLTGALGSGFTPSSWKARGGRLWFATAKGAATIDPAALPPAPAPPPLVIERLVANHVPVDLRQPPVLPPGTFDLEVHYTAPGLGSPEEVRFRYRLEGFDRDWVEAGGRRVAYYTNPPPGRFRFEVTAAHGGGPWNPEPATLSLRLLPRFHQTAAFKALVAAGAFLALYGLYRLRAGRIEARAAVAEERNRLAREIHDTLAQDLASILIQARVAGRQATKDPADVAARLERIADLAQSGLAEARLSLQALRPPALEGKDLATALREAARDLAAEPGPSIEVDVAAAEAPLAAPVEIELLRIGKEAMTNAVRHAGAGRVQVALAVEGEEAVLRVRDDGRGFDPAKSAAGAFGLVGMRERAESLGGSLRVESGPGVGTRIEARVPVGGR